MKRLTTKILTIAACAAMMLTAAPLANVQSVQAAVKAQGTVNLETKKLAIPKGSTTVLKNNTLVMVKGRRYAVKFKIKGKAYNLATLPATVGTAKVNTTAIASIKNNMLVANKAGTTTFRVVKGSKNLVTLKVKVIDTTAHKHAWKTITKATCATKGKKLCETCGGTGTTAVSKTHNFEITKKATCKTKGTETCSVCGLKNTLPKTAHHYITKTNIHIEGRGKKTKYETSMLCPGCRWDMTEWTTKQRQAHQGHIEAMIEGKLSDACLSAGYTGVAGAIRYEKRVKVQTTETYCENCGAWDMDKTYEKDLYYVDAKGNKIGANEDPYAVWSYENYCKEHGFVLCENCNLEVMPGVECHRCHTVAPTTTSATASVRKAAARKAVASPQDIITEVPDNNESFEATDVIVSDNATVSENTVSADAIVENTIAENEAISDNAVSENSVSDNSVSENEINGTELNTTITDPDQGGDIVFEDPDEDGIVIENREDNDGIIIETVDDNDANDDILIEDITDESDDGADDYDGSEGEVIEDE